MNFEIEKSPAYSVLKVMLEPNENVVAEAGAMMAMKGDVTVKTKTAGGLIRGLIRRLTVGETVFLNTFIAGSGGGTLWLAPNVPGDIQYVKLEGKGLIVQDTSYLAHHGNIEYQLRWRGLRGLLAEGNLIWLRLYGQGGVWVNSYGGILTKKLDEGERITADNFHLVAFDDTIDFSIKKFGGWKSFFLGGEGIVVELRGPGTVYMQTRVLPPLAEALSRFLPRSR